MKYICGINNSEIIINFPEGINKNIFVALSGGADSAILLYILAKLNIELKTNHTLIPITIPKPDGSAIHSPKIVNWINEKLNTSIQEPIIFGDGTLHHTVVIRTAMENLLSDKLCDYVFIATNMPPPIDIPGLASIYNPRTNYTKVSVPFQKVTKDCIIDLYYKENVQDLLKLSHSCTEQTAGRCNVCFQCGERRWAFSMLNLEDPGSN